jgi:uncharacterized glyoxalase superfamily protein PhnB
MTDTASPVPDPDLAATPPQISRDVYGMPMFASLRARSLTATLSWYVDGLGFVVLFEIPGPRGRPALVHLRRWKFQDLLVRPADRPTVVGDGCVVSLAAVYGEVDALAERARAHGGGRVDGPMDTAWNTRDVTMTDPDGVAVVFTAARPRSSADPAFAELLSAERVGHAQPR